MPPTFLALDEVLETHRDQIDRYGGTTGVRDLGLLESALAMPQAGSGGEYLHADFFDMAAAYLFYLAKDHPFIDGNKRVAAATALVFLEVNEVEVELTNKALVDSVIATVEGRLSKEALAACFRDAAI